MSWPMVRVGEVADVLRGVTFSKGDASDVPSAGVPILRAGNIQDTLILDEDLVYLSEGFVSEKQKIIEGDIVMCMSSGSANVLGKSALVKASWNGSFGAFLAVIRARPDVADAAYLSHYFRLPAFRSWASASNGIGIKNIRLSDLAAHEIPLPPLEEQKRIAGILDQADALRRLRARALEKLNTLGQAVFQEMFGDVKFNEKQFVKYKLKDFCEIKLGKMLDKEKNKVGESRKYLRNANVRWFSFDLSSLYEMPFTEKEIESFSVRSGDLLICEGGEPGRCAIWEAGDEEIFYQKALHRLRINKDIAIVDFLERWFFAAAKSGVLSDSVTQATISHLTGEKIKNLSIFLPPIDLQVVFAARLTGVKDHLSVAARALNEAESLFVSLQSAAFQGRL